MWQGGLAGPGGRSICCGKKMEVGMGCGRGTKHSPVEEEENQWIKKKHMKPRNKIVFSHNDKILYVRNSKESTKKILSGAKKWVQRDCKI